VVVPAVVEEVHALVDGRVHDLDGLGLVLHVADVPAAEAEDRDVDAGATATWTISGASTHGSIAITTAGVWTYSLDNADTDTQALKEGQSVTETYSVTVDDGHGSTATQDVVITITGTNDVVSITSTAQAGSVVEDADTTLSASDSLSASGTVSFTDVDLADGHTAVHNFFKTSRSSSVAQPARNIPTRSAPVGIC